MTVDLAATVFAGLIFGVFVYVINFKRINGRWPSVRNPFF